MLSVIATLEIQQGKEAEFEGHMQELAGQVRANEPGCKLYQLCRNPKHPTTYVVIERYTDQAAFDHHMSTDYFQAYFPKLAECFAGAPKIEILDEVD